MSKKYELTDRTIEYYGVTLHRIRALKEFGLIKRGDLGGWVESEENLSQHSDCWINYDAVVYGAARIEDNAYVGGDAQVFGNAIVKDNATVDDWAHVFGNAIISHNATVSGISQVFGNAKVKDNSQVFESAHVYGNAYICGHAHVSGNSFVYGNVTITDMASIFGNAAVFEKAFISGNIKITGNSVVHGKACLTERIVLKDMGVIKSCYDYLAIGPIGSRGDTTVFYKSKIGIMANCGCFNDTIDKFKNTVLDTHGKHPEYLEPYLMAINMAKNMLNRR